MNTHSLLLFFFSGLGAFNGLLISLYFLIFARPRHLSNYFLGGLLLMLSTRIGKSVFFYFNPDLAKIYLQIGLSACFFIGPFLFLYVRSIVDAERSKNLWKFLLPPLFVIAMVLGWMYPYESHPEIWRQHFIINIYRQWLVFLILSGLSLFGTFKKAFDKTQKLDRKEVWVMSVFLGVFAIWFAYFTSRYTSYIVGALSFSFVLYSSIFVFFANRGKKPLIPPTSKPKYANKKIEDQEAQAILKKIEKVMLEEQAYKNPNLTLPKLAKQLNISTHMLSQLLNDKLEKSFPNFINEYRIEEAKRILQDEPHLKIEVVAEQCGFNSNSTFYAAFKKFTDTTPARYIGNI